MKETNQLQVWYEERKVGTLALTSDRRVAFEYDDVWLEEGFSIILQESARKFLLLNTHRNWIRSIN